MNAHSQFIKDVLKAHLRSLNIRLAKHGVREMTACGGRGGEPLVTDVGMTIITSTRCVGKFTARFPTKPDEMPAVDANNALPQREFELELNELDDYERPTEGGKVRIETDHGVFDGVVCHDQARWRIRWTADFSKSFGKGPASGGGSSGNGSPDEKWPANAGFKYL